jgi:hypothetical protein
MHDAALGGETIFRPRLLDVDEGALALAKQQMLKRGKRNEFVFGEHH